MDVVIADIFADYAAQCSRALAAAGYAAVASDEAETIRAFANVSLRRVPQQKRAVHKANYAVQPDLAVGESEFLKKARAGEDLRPHQSTRITRSDFNDGMLNDYGIHHFHLGTQPHPSLPGFVGRTDPVLFAMVRDDDFYSVGLYKHTDWSERTLLDVVHATWPELLKPYAVNSPGLTVIKPRHNYTTEEIGRLRAAGVNTLTTRPDGTVHAPPGGGISLNKTSAKNAFDLVRLRRHCRLVTDQIRKELATKISRGELSPPLVVNTDWSDPDGGWAVVVGHRIRFQLGLAVPPV